MRRLKFQTLESRHLLATLQFLPQGDLDVITEQGNRIVEVAPGQMVGIAVEVAESEEGIAGYQLNFGNSSESLVLQDYFPPFGFGAVSDETLDSSNGDFFVLGATFTIRTVPPVLALGGFTVAVPEFPGEYVLTANSTDQQPSQDTLLVGDNPIEIADFGDLVFRVLPQLPTVEFSQAEATLQESSGQAFFEIFLSTPATREIRIPLAVGGTATFDQDYELSQTEVVFSEGETRQTISVLVRDDNEVELNELVSLRLSEISDATIGSLGNLEILITDNDVTPAEFEIVPQSMVITEGQEGADRVDFTVIRMGDTTGEKTLRFETAGAGEHPVGSDDFPDGLFPSGQVTFGDGQSQISFSIQILGDRIVESDEAFLVSLSDQTDQETTRLESPIITIENDDSLGNSLVLLNNSLAGPLSVPTEMESGGLHTSVLFTANQSGVIQVSEAGVSPSFSRPIVLNSNQQIISRQVGENISATLIQGEEYAIVAFSEGVPRTLEITELSGAFTVGTRTNFLQPTDANGDGVTSALDALVIINALARNLAAGDSVVTTPFLDVGQNGEVTALDALQVLNQIPNPTESSLDATFASALSLDLKYELASARQTAELQFDFGVPPGGLLTAPLPKLIDSSEPLTETQANKPHDGLFESPEAEFGTDKTLDILDTVFRSVQVF